MEYTQLGRSGLSVSRLCLGTMNFGPETSEADSHTIMDRAHEQGINFFDNAEGYEQGNAEKVMGEALTALNWTRDSYAVSSKVFWGGSKPTQRGLSAKHITDACHAALKRLQA